MSGSGVVAALVGLTDLLIPIVGFGDHHFGVVGMISPTSDCGESH
jgi:hypothetical protein